MIGFNNSNNIPPRQWTSIKYVNQLIDCFMPEKTPNDELEQGVRDNDIASVRRAIARGADTERKTQYGDTLLHLAAGAGHTDIALTLIDAGADIEAQNAQGNTPLHNATFNKHLSLTIELIRKGANLLALNPSQQTPIVFIISLWDPKMLDSLISSGFDINMKVQNKNTLLHLAVEYNRIEMLSALIKLGVNVNEVNDAGVAPLHLAVLNESPNKEIIDKLIDAGANVTLQTYYRKNVLEVCLSDKIKLHIQARTAANAALDVKSPSLLSGFNNTDHSNMRHRVVTTQNNNNNNNQSAKKSSNFG